MPQPDDRVACHLPSPFPVLLRHDDDEVALVREQLARPDPPYYNFA